MVGNAGLARRDEGWGDICAHIVGAIKQADIKGTAIVDVLVALDCMCEYEDV
jgi:hypothetical protein